jgi:hypothetical protein
MGDGESPVAPPSPETELKWKQWGKKLGKEDLVVKKGSLNENFILLVGRHFVPYSLIDSSKNKALGMLIIEAKIEMARLLKKKILISKKILITMMNRSVIITQIFQTF